MSISRLFRRFATIVSGTTYEIQRKQTQILALKGQEALPHFNKNDQEQLQQWIKSGKLLTCLTTKQYRSALTMHKKNLKWPFHFQPPDLTKIPSKGPVRHLTIPLRKKGGRNSTGRITVRHRGGGFKRRIRLLDWNRIQHMNHSQQVVRLEHDPGRTCNRIALLQDLQTKQLSYILPPVGLEAGTVLTNDKNPILGHSLLLSDIAVGTEIYNIEIKPGKGGQLVRSAGTKAKLVGLDEQKKHAIIELPSKKTIQVSLQCTASIGQVACPDHMHKHIGSAGRNRRLGWRPTVRGVAMNAVDHPHGGGKGGKSKGHLSQSPWGKICK